MDTFYLILRSNLCTFVILYTKSTSAAFTSKSSSGCSSADIAASSVVYGTSGSNPTLRFASAAIVPNTEYEIIVGNDRGSVVETGSKFISAEVQSGVVQGLSASSSASSFMAGNRISVSWRPPSSSSFSMFIQYEIILRLHGMGHGECVGLWSIDCSDCASSSPTNPPQKRSNGFKLCLRTKYSPVSLGSYRKYETSFSVNLNSSKILPNLYFLLEVQPINWWGWGRSKGQYVTTRQIKSSAPKIASVFTSFPISSVSVVWSGPSSPNGAVSQYLVVLRSRDGSNCIRVWSVTCSDSTNNTVGDNGNAINTPGCPTAVGVTYSPSSTSLTVSGNNISIIPGTIYTFHVQARNGWGYGEKAVRNFTSAQYKSNIPTITNVIFVKSSFQWSNVSVVWSGPSSPNGAVSQYLVVLRSRAGSSCIIVWNVTCSDCSDKTVGNNDTAINTSGCPTLVRATYSSSSATLTIYGYGLNIEPFTNYTVHVQPRNGWGYGKEAKFRLKSPYISGAPKIILISSVFPDSKLWLQWTAPKVPNGAVSEYTVVLNSGFSGACIAVWRVTCSDCSDKAFGGYSGARVDVGCSRVVVVGSSYNSNQSPFILSHSDNILPSTNYTVVLQVRNGWGYGNVTSKNFTSGFFKNENTFPVVLVAILVSVFILIGVLVILVTILKRRRNVSSKRTTNHKSTKNLEMDGGSEYKSTTSIKEASPNLYKNFQHDKASTHDRSHFLNRSYLQIMSSMKNQSSAYNRSTPQKSTVLHNR